MFLSRFAAVTVAAMVLWSVPVSAGGPLRSFEYGFWSGGAYTDDRTGAFTHCSAGVAYDSGVNLFVLVTAHHRWWLGFINPKWSFAANEKASVRLRLDGGTPFERLATVPNAQLLLVPLPDSSDLIDAFRHSSELALDTKGHALLFKLKETPGMMDRLAGCVGTSLALNDKVPLVGSQSANVAPSTEPTKAAATPAKPIVAKPSPQSASVPSSIATAATRASAAATAVVAPKAAPKSVEDGVPAKTADTAATPVTSAQKSPDPHTAPAHTAASTTPSVIPHQTTALTHAGPPAPPLSSARFVSSAAQDAPSPYIAAAFDEPSAASAAKSQAPQTQAAPLPQSVAFSSRETDGASLRIAGGSPSPSIAALPPVPVSGDKPQATLQTSRLVSGQPPLAFTAVTPAPALSTLGPGPAAGSALEEVRLATQFLTSAQLADAHLIVSDKPPALADFAAVWRSGDAAGAVKIIPPGPAVSAIAIASNLIAVDPQLCKGDFTTARFHTDVGNRTVFSAVLSCYEANEERVTEYLIAPRQRGGFVVFAVIRSTDGGEVLDLDRQKLEGLSRAAIQAVGGQG